MSLCIAPMSSSRGVYSLQLSSKNFSCVSVVDEKKGDPTVQIAQLSQWKTAKERAASESHIHQLCRIVKTWNNEQDLKRIYFRKFEGENGARSMLQYYIDILNEWWHGRNNDVQGIYVSWLVLGSHTYIALPWSDGGQQSLPPRKWRDISQSFFPFPVLLSTASQTWSPNSPFFAKNWNVLSSCHVVETVIFPYFHLLKIQTVKNCGIYGKRVSSLILSA